MGSHIRSAFITGAASGIGRALAHRLADQGASLYVTDWDGINLRKVEAELKKKQVNVQARVVDVSEREAMIKAADEADQLFDGVDAVFNNAGISLSDTAAEMQYDDFEKMMNVTFWGVVHGTKAFLPKMLKRNHGHIINVSSIFGHIGVPTQSAYCAAKHAVKGFNESIYYELDGSGVQIHSVHPGGVDTNIVTNGKHIHTMSGDNDVEKIQANFKEVAVTSPDRAAEIILDGVAEGTYRILVGKDAVWMDRLQRWMPKRWMKMFMKRFREGHGLT